MASAKPTPAKTSKKPVAAAAEEVVAKPAAKKTAKAAPAKTSTAVATRKTSAVSTGADMEAIKARLRQQAEAMGERTQAPGGIKIQVTQDKQFKLPDGQTVDELIACVVDFRVTHNFYDGPYNPKEIVPPSCFAVGQNPKAMIPIKESPQLQAESCQVCPQNQFGSSPTGEGKACKNGRLLALLPPDDSGEDVDSAADLWLLGVSPTALRGWDGYVQTLARNHQLPPVAFMTRISFNPALSYGSLQFELIGPADNFAGAAERQAEAGELLEQIPDWSAVDADAPKAKKNPIRKPVGKVAPQAPVKAAARGMARR